MSAANMRVLLSKWVADGIEEMKKNYDVVGCFRRCGYANCSKGCENFYIKVAGCKEYEPPKLGDPVIVPPPRKKSKKSPLEECQRLGVREDSKEPREAEGSEETS